MENSGWDYGVPIIKIVGESFCVPYTMEMLVKKRIQGMSNANYDVYNISGNLLLQIEGSLWKFHKKRVMHDPPLSSPCIKSHLNGAKSGRFILVKAQKIKTIFSSNFKVEQPNPLHIKTKLEIFLPSNDIGKKVPDFYITGSFSSQSFKVYRGKTVISQANHNYSWGSLCKGKENFKVRVHPEVDYSCITALLVILEENET